MTSKYSSWKCLSNKKSNFLFSNKGGNQREQARLKNLKKAGATKAGETEANKGLTLEQRNQRDAEKMRQKQLEALKKKEADGAASGASGGN